MTKEFKTRAHFEAALVDAGMPQNAAEFFGDAFGEAVEKREIHVDYLGSYTYQYATPDQIEDAFWKMLDREAKPLVDDAMAERFVAAYAEVEPLHKSPFPMHGVMRGLDAAINGVESAINDRKAH